MSRLLLSILLLGFCFSALAQDYDQRFARADVLHYKFEIGVYGNFHYGYNAAHITTFFKTNTDSLTLDFVKSNKSGSSSIKKVEIDGNICEYIWIKDKLTLIFPTVKAGETHTISVYYSFGSDDGLIIALNRFNKNTAFADNWPNRARHWIPTIDHPGDKATVEFLVNVPSNLDVIANGKLQSVTKLEKTRSLWHYKTDYPLPTKVMVIGVADFETQVIGNFDGTEVSTWVFADNSKNGFADYNVASEPLVYFNKLIGPYPFDKLANVQSKTRYGGMENASAIFYAENTVTGKGRLESLFAHEIAHQWFGNSVSESNWYHVWLSEGFATYLENCYMGFKFGTDTFNYCMKYDGNLVRNFNNRVQKPVIDTTITDYEELLNPNSYQKGAWFLHMLRKQVGDSLFWLSVRKFNDTYKFANADTRMFKEVVETQTGRKLDNFFNCWLYKPGLPRISTAFQSMGDSIKITIIQEQNADAFEFKLDVRLKFLNDVFADYTFDIKEKFEVFFIKNHQQPLELIADPNGWLLRE